jgi:hypothetical protein
MGDTLAPIREGDRIADCIRLERERDEARRDLSVANAERDQLLLRVAEHGNAEALLAEQRDRCMDLGAELVEWRHDATEEQRAAIKARCGGKDPLAARGSQMNMVQFAAALDAMQKLQGGEREDAEDELRYAFIRVCLERDTWREKAEARGTALEEFRLSGTAYWPARAGGIIVWYSAGGQVAAEFYSNISASIGVDPALLQDAAAGEST